MMLFVNSTLSLLYYILAFISLTLFHQNTVHGCDIVGASACPHKPDNDLKEENFEDYCNKYKLHIECVNKKYSGCDKKDKYAEAMDSMVRGLRKKAKQIAELCEFEIDIPQPTTKKPVDSSKNSLRNNGKVVENVKTSTGPPCKINTISQDSSYFNQCSIQCAMERSSKAKMVQPGYFVLLLCQRKNC